MLHHSIIEEMEADVIQIEPELVAPPKTWKPVRRICGAPTTDGTPCENKSGQRTKHKGRGVCWLHETNPLAIIPSKNALKFIDVAFQSRVNELMLDDDLLNLRRDIAVARTLLERLESGQEWVPEDKPKIEYYNQLLNTIGKLVERYEHIERERHGLVKVQVVLSVRDAFVDAIMCTIADPNTRMMLYDRLNADLRKTLPLALKSPM